MEKRNGALDTYKYIDLVRRRNAAVRGQNGNTPTACVRTFGCQQNVSDSERLGGLLREMGYGLTEKPDDADLILFNTCAVRENAEDRVFGHVGALRGRKRADPGLIIALCGCMMQQEHIADKIRQSYPYVDIVFGTGALARFPELLWRRLSGGTRIFSDRYPAPDELPGEDLPVRRDGKIRAWVPVMYGCDNFCAYCVVPLVRGRERSRESVHIIGEARELVENGYKEITLLGQNVNSYGRTLSTPLNFSGLLRELNAIDGDFRIRFTTSHPKDCTRELIDTVADCEKVCNHIHLPVQCGSDRILNMMNRGYTARDYLSLIEYARTRIPDVSFTSDIIVGFPGEQAEDFRQTLELVEKVRFHSLFTFLYSRREGTVAADLPDETPKEEKLARFDRLLALQRDIAGDLYGGMVGGTYRVLAEGEGRSGPGCLYGKTEQGVVTEFEAPRDMIGRFVNVTANQALSWALMGSVN